MRGFLILMILALLQPGLAQAANGASTGVAATTVLFVFGAVVLSLGALGVAAFLWLRGRRWRLRIADERATIDDLMGPAEDLLAASSNQRLNAVMQDANLMRTLLDRAPFPVWRRGPDLTVMWANQFYCEAVEANFADVVEQGLELVPGVASETARALARAALASGQTRVERRRFVVGGARRTYELIETPLESGDLAGYAHDITDRDDAAGELARYIDAQNGVFDQLLSGIAIFAPDKQLVFSNVAYARIWQLDEEWLAATPSHGDVLERLRDNRQLPEQADFPAYKAEVMKLYTNVMERQEEQMHLPDGRTLRMVTSPHPLGGLLFIFEDVSDRLELVRARNTVVAVQQATLDHLIEGIAVFGADGRLKLFNTGYARLWNLDKAMLSREPHVSEITDMTRPLFQADVKDDDHWPTLKEEIIRDTLGRKTSEDVIRRPDGKVLRHAAVPLPDGAMLHSYLDITDTARLRIELEGKVSS